jgi:hypothetical protein
MKTTKLNYDKIRFKNDAEFLKFLDDKMKSLFIKINANIEVFKRLKDK